VGKTKTGWMSWGATPDPCCYRQAGWYDKGAGKTVYCVEKGSDKMSVATPPDSCTPLEVGEWDPLPECGPYCKNFFDKVQHVDQSAAKCTTCIEGGQGQNGCDCDVKCSAGTMRQPSGPEEGIKNCLATTNPFLPKFESAPQCAVFCAIPDSAGGTLDLSGCKDVCFPGMPCSCRVTCAEDNFNNGKGGSEGEVTCASDGNLARFVGLPSCMPVCVAPKDELRTVDVSRCQSRCNAIPVNERDDTCNCEVTCLVPQTTPPGQGQPGKQFCMFVPGDATTAGYGKWVTADKTQWPTASKPEGNPGWDQMPSCSQPIVLAVVDATNGAVLENAIIQCMDGDDPRVVQQVLKTSNTGLAMYQTALVNLQFKITLDGYNVFEDTKNRLTYCSDPTRCIISFPISKKLGGGDVHPAGCFFTAKSNMGVTFEMRAVLTWNENPADLDIWVRNVGCSEDTRKRYLCWRADEPQWDNGIGGDSCQRYRFREGNTQYLEKQACATKVCSVKTSGQESTVFYNGVPQCYNNYPNDFPKWIFWKARMMDKMDLRIEDFSLPYNRIWPIPDVATSGTLYRNGDAGDWKYRTAHWIVLDVDQRSGKGPETVTFHNVPPGTYQIAVDQFTDAPNIKDANPEVRIYLGGNAISFRCTIPVNCQAAERVWSVVDIQIQHMPHRYIDPQDGSESNKYSVRLVDDYARMAGMSQDTAPSSSKGVGVYRSGPPCLYGMCTPRWEDYYQPMTSYLDEDYKAQCHGRCYADMGTHNIGFEDCLDHR